MKKILPAVTMLLAFMGCITLMAFELQQNGNARGKNDQPGKGNQKKEQGRPDNPRQGNKEKENGQGMQNDKDNGDNDRGNNGNNQGNKGKGNDKGKANDDFVLDTKPGKGNGRKVRINLPGDNKWYNWNNDNFRNREEVRKKEKVTICHKFNSSDPVTITISENALKAHLAHGDVRGNCAPVNNSIFSDIFRKRRTAYYNDVYNAQDQYNYSNSILDYAIMRLANSRLQLNQMRMNNAPQADIDRREASVMELEQNVSLLETALGIAGELLVSRL